MLVTTVTVLELYLSFLGLQLLPSAHSAGPDAAASQLSVDRLTVSPSSVSAQAGNSKSDAGAGCPLPMLSARYFKNAFYVKWRSSVLED